MMQLMYENKNYSVSFSPEAKGYIMINKESGHEEAFDTQFVKLVITAQEHNRRVIMAMDEAAKEGKNGTLSVVPR